MFRVTACGESYGKALMIICDGVPPGIELSNESIQEEMDKRRPGTSPIDSPRLETDKVDIVAGIRDGFTTGAPVGLIIYNVDRQDIHVEQYRQVKDLVRPGHAEYTFFVKYGKFADWCGAGRASGRESACRVAGGAVARKILEKEGIQVIAYTKELMDIKMRDDLSFEEKQGKRHNNDIRCPDEDAAEKMFARCLEIKEEGDTAGGIIEIIARGVPAGLGEPVFDKLEADLAKALMSIGAVKGVEIGAGFGLTKMKGSQSNDIPYLEDGKVRFKTNRCGGFLGGISNGEDLVLRIAVKPTATISIDQQTVNMKEMKEATLGAITRRDPTICARINPVAEAMTCITILDHLMMFRGYKNVAKIDNPWDADK